jgi:hypothetical protein
VRLTRQLPDVPGPQRIPGAVFEGVAEWVLLLPQALTVEAERVRARCSYADVLELVEERQ